ncbi:protein phosphatase 2C domain-containing protein [Streptomyces sp. NBC_00887]|uniref:protein phosphatase 2C domain-containing protein n=1 Tax=Streptomyces sp. NBC_00887 TaxID=2975859 RepID=UPI00386EF2B3|nr:protein phosphatase 2C domain-containing protein [Streptomyces sp. NBC_00887]
MSQQGETPAAHEDDWWRRLYDETAPDTGPSSAADSLDDRFDSASDAVGTPEGRVEPVTYADPGTYAGPVTDAGLVTDADTGTPAGPGVGSPDADRQGTAPAPDAFAAVQEGGAAVPVPDPRLPARASAPGAPPTGAHRRQQTAPEVPPVPQRAAADGVPAPPRSVPAVPPTPAGPPPPVPTRTVACPAPWEPPAGSPQPRTFSAAPPSEPAAGPAGAAAAQPEFTPDGSPGQPSDPVPASRPVVGHIGDRPPTYDAEPVALPVSGPGDLDGLVADTVLDGARYGTYTLRAASVRGDSARFRGEPRRDAMLTARFGAGEGSLVLVAVAGGARAAEHAHLAAADACRWIGGAVGRSHARLSDDIRAGRRGDLKSGLHRLTDRTYGKLRARAAELGIEADAYTVGLRCLLLSADPECRTRVFFGIGDGGLFRLRDGAWQDLEPPVPPAGAGRGEPVVGFGSAPQAGAVSEEGPGGDRLTMDLQIATPPSPYIESPVPPPAEPFRFRASVARPGDTLLLCSNGLAEPMRGEPALSEALAERWGAAAPPGLAAFLADVQTRAKGYADDRTSAAVWEA